MNYTICSDCDYCRTDRKNEQGQVRCTRFSKFVNSNDKTCEAYCDKETPKAYELFKGGAE